MNEYVVDGIVFRRDGEYLIITFKVEDMKHEFRVPYETAEKMAKVLRDLYLTEPKVKN